MARADVFYSRSTLNLQQQQPATPRPPPQTPAVAEAAPPSHSQSRSNILLNSVSSQALAEYFRRSTARLDRGSLEIGVDDDDVERESEVGSDGELEHAAAILHPKMGAPVRKVLGKGAALIPSSKKRVGVGCTLDIPLGHKDAAFVRSHFDGMEVQINDAPRANEIMVALAVTDSGRPLPRVGGLTVAEIKGDDGLR